MVWTDAETGEPYRISTSSFRGEEAIRVKSIRDIVTLYRRKREAKSLGSDGAQCGRGTAGLLSRRSVRDLRMRAIGKEANEIDDLTVALVSADAVTAEYQRPGGKGKRWQRRPHALCPACVSAVGGRRRRETAGAPGQTRGRKRRRPCEPDGPTCAARQSPSVVSSPSSIRLLAATIGPLSDRIPACGATARRIGPRSERWCQGQDLDAVRVHPPSDP